MSFYNFSFFHRKLREELLLPRTRTSRANRAQPEAVQVYRETEDEMKQESCLRNMSEWRELALGLDCTYIIHSQPFEPGFDIHRAMTSIQNNLTFHCGLEKEVRAAVLTPSVNFPQDVLNFIIVTNALVVSELFL